MLPLRHAVLRTGRAWADAFYEADDDPSSAHFAAFAITPPDEAAVLAVGSVLPESPDWFDGDQSAGDQSQAGEPAWRVRGMATRSDQRGSGIGGLVLGALLDHVKTEGGGLVWCTARLGALTFYGRAGFVTRGDPRHVDGIGPHQTMWREVQPA